jgi:MauM/NapG family ferredoxin protein
VRRGLSDRRALDREKNVNRRGILGVLAAIGTGLLGFMIPRRAAATSRVRPPGARPEPEFERACIRCFRCGEVCPVKAIRFESSLDLRAADLPFLNTRERACILCMKCTEVCPTAALLEISPSLAAIQTSVRMGTPDFERSRCYPWNGKGNCRLCYYVCPFADRAIQLLGPTQAPLYHPEACVGCGLCEEACPEAAQAIRIVPLGVQR